MTYYDDEEESVPLVGDTEITVTLNPWSTSDLANAVAERLAKGTKRAISEKVEELLGESIEALIRETLGRLIQKAVDELATGMYTPVDEVGASGEPVKLEDHIRQTVSTFMKEMVKRDREGRYVREDYRGGQPRYKAMVEDAARDVAGKLVEREIASHVQKMRQDVTEGVKALVAEHIVQAAEKRQLNGGLS